MSNPRTEQIVDKVLDMSRNELISTLLQTNNWHGKNIPEEQYEEYELQDLVFNHLLETLP